MYDIKVVELDNNQFSCSCYVNGILSEEVITMNRHEIKTICLSFLKSKTKSAKNKRKRKNTK